jgi:hypothetical protein
VTEQSTNAVVGSKPWPVIIMVAMVASVIIAGFILAPRTEEDKLRWLTWLGTTNHGEFINPPIGNAPAFKDAEGYVWPQSREPVWRLVLVSQGDCDLPCQEMADLVFRVHTRLNKLAPRVQRGFLSLAGTAALAPTPPGFSLLQSDLDQFSTLFAEAGLETDLANGPLLLIQDPRDVFFMYYTPSHEGTGILSDVEHLIKLSR